MSWLVDQWKILTATAERSGGAVSDQAANRARDHRLAMSFLTALIASYWIGPLAASAWVLWIVGYELVGLPWVLRTFIHPINRARPKEAHRRAAILTFVGSCFFVAGWAPAWIVGGESASYFAALWLACALIHALVYNSNDRVLFLSSCAPGVMVAIVVPFVIGGNLLLPLVLMLATGRVLVTTYIAQRDRNALLSSVMENRLQRKAAEESNVAKSQFLATMSHELRTPLNAVIGYAEILEEDLDADGNQPGAADAARIRRAARNLLVLINEVLDFSKIEAGRMELSESETDVSALLQDVVETTQVIAQQNGNAIDVAIDESVGALVFDAQRVKQCVLNLVSNACKFTKDGRVSIRATIAHERGGDMLSIAVVDTGCGITETDQARLFQPFVQADGSSTRKHDGTGLGLAITRKLAQLMGGDVDMESAVGVGSRFTLRIAARRTETASAGGEGPPVLVIEDEAAARELTRRALARLPFAVHGASTAAEGLRLARELSPVLILLDLHLPDGSGWDVLAALRQDGALKDTPVMVCTVDDARARALASGACEHLQKPIDRDQLAAAVMRFARTPHETQGHSQSGRAVA